MAVRDLIIDIKSRWDERGSKAAEEALKKTEEAAKRSQRELERMERAAAKARAEMEATGQTVSVFGAAAVAGIGMAVKAAVDWESAWVGVTKTVEGTPQQMAALEGALRSLARELPATHAEIAAVAEAAGQLGIKRESIIGFTRTMVALGETTDLSAEQAATALARLSNIMGTPQQEVGRLGASLVALGNAGASTESEIVEMALRIAGAGKTIGLSEGQVLGFASALSSVGINAEAGGSSISRVMITIAQAVDAGGQQVERFAQVAGMSADEFSTAFREDAGSALGAFIEGLGRVEASGGSLFQTLQQLGFSEIEVRDALLRTAQAGSLLTDSLRLGEQAWSDNTALAEEAAKRYETTASKLKVAQNNVTDLGITIGETFLPVLGEAAEHTSGWIALLQDLPEPVKAAGGVVGGLAGVVTLAGGAAMIAVPKMVDFTKTLEGMGPRGAAMASRLSAVGSFLMGPWGAALAAATVLTIAFADMQAEAAGRVKEFTDAIIEDHGVVAALTKEKIAFRLVDDGLIESAKQLGLNLDLVTGAFSGNKEQAAALTKQLDEMFEARMGKSSGIAFPWDEDARKIKNETDAILTLKDSLGEYGRQLDAAKGKAQDHADVSGKAEVKVNSLETAMKGLSVEMGGQGRVAGDLSSFMQGLATTYGLVGDDASKAAQKMLDSWSSAFSQFGDMSSVLQDLGSSGGGGSSAADRQAAAVERLAEVQRTGADKIKRAQRDVADAHEQAAEQSVEAQERIKDAQEALTAATEEAARKEADAVQAVADAQERVAERREALATATEEAARKEADAAQSVADAQEKIGERQEALAAAAERAAQREADAVQKIADARQRVADVAEDSGRKIESATRRVADVQEDAAQREIAAERRLQDSHQRTIEAEQDLVEARERAAQRLEDLARAQFTGELDEEGAQIALERAKERLDEITADPEASSLDRREADLAFKRAKERLEEIQRRNSELKQELADANEAGIEGSTEVIGAKERIAAAIEAEREAEAALAKQREEAARAVADAEQALADARRDAARQQEDASRSLAEAEASLAEVRLDGAKDILKAQKDISDAQKEAADASAALDRTRIDGAKDILKAQKDISDAEKAAAEAAVELDRTRAASAQDVLKARKDIADAEKEAAKATRDAARDISDAEESLRKARQDAARDTVKANQDVRDSWVDLGGTVAVTTTQYLAELEKQVKDQENWADNLISLAGRVPDEMLKELAELGPGGAKVVQLATQMSGEELQRFIALHGKSGKEAGDTFAENLAAAGPVLRSIAQTRGQEIADRVREGMDGGRTSVFEAARRIGVEIDNGIGKNREITVFVKTDYQDDLSREALRAAVGLSHASGGIDRYESGGIERYAVGGLRRPTGPMIAGRPMVLFGEGRDDEAFIPYDSAYRPRAESLLAQVASDFGGMYLRPMGAVTAPVQQVAAPQSRRREPANFNFEIHAAPAQDPRAVAEEVYLLSISRGY
ncbi:phage tail tape measure protein [Streptosporangium sp. NPDC001559]|uniref:phage tail tape measure protein n=1 Tax=Streptosporangium sp. NPDC001559 TaxID=3366187 RepID=UPI0036EBD8C2